MQENSTSKSASKTMPGKGLSLLVPFFQKNWKTIVLGLSLMVAVDVLQLLVPQIIKACIDGLSLSAATSSTVLTQTLIIICLGIAMTILRYLWRVTLMGVARDLELVIRDDLFGHLLQLDAQYYEATKAGDLMAHATSDINYVRMAFGIGIIVLVDSFLLGTTTLGIMIFTHPKLTLYAMLPMPFLIYLTRYLGKKTHDLHKSAQESFSFLTEQIRECFFGIRIIRVCNFTPSANQRIANSSRDYYQKNLKRAIVMSLLTPVMSFFFNASTLIIIIYGGYLIMHQGLSAGDLVAFLQYLGLLSWPIVSIGWMINLYERGMASLNRIGEVLHTVPGIPAVMPDTNASVAPLEGNITFDNVCFRHGSSQDMPMVLSNIHLNIPAGTRVGITGPPGSGKTSLLHLIPRIYDVSQGCLLVDGKDIRQFAPGDIRSRMGFMSQEPFLFSATILDNICMGRTVCPEELERLLYICDLEDTIASMPDKLATMTGERGVALSGGQKQRITLARALVGHPRILLLDDPISQLDTRTAHRILSRMGASWTEQDHQPTMLIISHRISAIADCDVILILEQGRIHAQGTHEELLAQNLFYQTTFHAQQFEETLEQYGNNRS